MRARTAQLKDSKWRVIVLICVVLIAHFIGLRIECLIEIPPSHRRQLDAMPLLYTLNLVDTKRIKSDYYCNSNSLNKYRRWPAHIQQIAIEISGRSLSTRCKRYIFRSVVSVTGFRRIWFFYCVNKCLSTARNVYHNLKYRRNWNNSDAWNYSSNATKGMHNCTGTAAANGSFEVTTNDMTSNG